MKYGSSFKSVKHLASLSEYAADLGAMSLLKNHGFDPIAYLVFLDDVYTSAKLSESLKSAPFSWLEKRLECLMVFRDYKSIQSQPKIVIGSKEEGDDIIQTFESGSAQKLAQYFEAPTILRSVLSKYDNVDGLSDQQLLELTILYIQKHKHSVCSIANTFPELPVKNGVLKTPSFDLWVFLQYF